MAPLVLQVLLEQMVLQVRPELQAKREMLVMLEQQETLEVPVPLVLGVPLETLEILVQLEKRERRETQEQLEPPVRRVKLVRQVKRVKLELLDLKELLVRPDRLVILVTLEQPDHRELLAKQVKLELLDLKEIRARSEILVPLVRLVKLVIQVRLVLLDHRE